MTLKAVLRPQIGRDKPEPGEKTIAYFRGVDTEGDTALVRRTQIADYAQFDRLSHPKAYGWWKYAYGTFRKRPDRE